jgi:hypothetical protein
LRKNRVGQLEQGRGRYKKEFTVSPRGVTHSRLPNNGMQRTVREAAGKSTFFLVT